MNLAEVLIFLSFWKVPIISWECKQKEWVAQYIHTPEDPKWTLTICRENIDVWTVIHEWWHAYKHLVMTEKQVALWEKLSWSCKKREMFVSDYAMTNAEEDFAETFRWVGQWYGGANKVVKAKMKFINKLIK